METSRDGARGEVLDSPGLEGSRALIAGGTGSVGRVVVAAFLAAGAEVVVPSRSAEKAASLREFVDGSGGAGERLVTVVGDLSDAGDAVRVRDEVLSRPGGLDAVVATLGRFVPAPSVLDASRADLQAALDGYLVAHFMVARTFLPALRERGGSYVFINGPLAFAPLFPGAGLVSVVTAAQAMLARTVMKEEAEGAVRVNEVVVQTRFAPGDPADGAGPVSQGDVGRFLAALASPAGAGVRGETIHLDGEAALEVAAGR